MAWYIAPETHLVGLAILGIGLEGADHVTLPRHGLLCRQHCGLQVARLLCHGHDPIKR